MVKTTLKPWLRENFFVDVVSTEVLTHKEEEIVVKGVQVDYSLRFMGQQPPSIEQIKKTISENNPEVSSKLIDIIFHF